MSGQSFEIEGGHAIHGTIRPSGNKNAALPLLAATLLTDEEVVLRNVPDIRDVDAMMKILAALGVDVTKRAHGVYAFKAARVNGREPDPTICRTIRASILLAGPLLARRGHVSLPPPGGDVIGRRRIDTHVIALERSAVTSRRRPRRTRSARTRASSARRSSSTRRPSPAPRTR
jgi:UDP-N-acetylglucosamine 1-carboxyvinyltransferase